MMGLEQIKEVNADSESYYETLKPPKEQTSYAIRRTDEGLWYYSVGEEPNLYWVGPYATRDEAIKDANAT